MQVFRGAPSVPPGFGPSAVTVGKFDGLHVGHRAVVQELLAAAGGLASVVVTFDRNPLALLQPGAAPDPLTGTERKLELLELSGVQAVLLLEFDDAFAAQPPETFVDEVLVGPLDARLLLVGEDFRFGQGGRGDVALLTRLGLDRDFEVRVHEEVAAAERRVSSSWIRELLGAGAIEEATRLLGRPPEVRGTVVHGAHRGRELGYPTANLAPESDGMIPADGVYAGEFVDRTADLRWSAAISVGSNPTFEGVPPRQVEAYVLDAHPDLYGHVVDVVFTRRIRGQIAYAGVEPLIAQIAVDVEMVRAAGAGQ